MHKETNFINKRYGKLVVIKLDHTKQSPCGHKVKMWLCKCDCGNTKIVTTGSLTSGQTKSCGCYRRDRITKLNTSHNMSKSSLYKAWCNMKMRCTNPNYTDYYDYGGRGITICEEWLEFEAFKEWAYNNGYYEEKVNGKNLLSLDRIDVNGNYEPSNCRWATNTQQANNKRNTRRFFYNGQNLTVREWSDITGISYTTLARRLFNPTWTVERALTQPVHKYNKNTN